MPIITSIKPQSKKEGRFNIFLDGKFAFSLPAEIIVAAGLKEGQEVSQDQVNSLVKKNDFSLVFDRVLKFLSIRPRSEFEINEYMLQKGWGERTRTMVLEKLKTLQLLDDKAFVRWWIEQRSVVKPEGRNLLVYELRRKGINKETIEELMAENRSATTDEFLAEKVAVKKLGRLKGYSKIEMKKKLFYALSIKGFSSEVTRRVIDKLLERE